MAEENIFKRIAPLQMEVPTSLRDDVMEDVENAKLFMELTALFSLEYPQTVDQIFKKVKKRNQP